MKIGVLFGNPETTTGGNALKFYAAVRLDMRRMEAIKQGGDVTGNRVRVRVKKNKVAPPFKVAEFDIMFDHGISREGSILDVGVESGVIEKRGSFYSYGETRLGQGRENCKTFLRDNPALMMQVDEAIRNMVGFHPQVAAEDDAEVSAEVDEI